MKSASTDITQDPRRVSIVTRDKTADGTFWYSVGATGIFCRPSCPSRLANPTSRSGFRGHV
jgi:AraC family transcriptional regulator of adaptative response/methylated-DNA-[protein]-cysteine methyltransferase